MAVIAIGSVRSGGSSTLALTLAGTLADAGCSVLLVDAARNPDLVRWSHRPGRPDLISVARCTDGDHLRELVHNARRHGRTVVIDAGFKRDRLRAAFEMSHMALVPVRFSPLSVSAAIETDRLIDQIERRKPGGRAFVATAVTQIPSRIARAVEGQLRERRTVRLPAGLSLRAAFEAPFLVGGTVHTLGDDEAPGLARARVEAENLLFELDLYGLRRPARSMEVRRLADEMPLLKPTAPARAERYACA